MPASVHSYHSILGHNISAGGAQRLFQMVNGSGVCLSTSCTCRHRLPVLIGHQPVQRNRSAPCVGAEELKPDDSGSEQQKTLAAIGSRFSNKEVRGPLRRAALLSGTATASCRRDAVQHPELPCDPAVLCSR